MKNVLFVLSMLFVFAFAGMSFASAETEPTISDEIVLVAEESEVLLEEEALFCKAETADGGKVTCWFCDCSQIVEDL
jgi:hypothetical protein